MRLIWLCPHHFLCLCLCLCHCLCLCLCLCLYLCLCLCLCLCIFLGLSLSLCSFGCLVVFLCKLDGSLILTPFSSQLTCQRFFPCNSYSYSLMLTHSFIHTPIHTFCLILDKTLTHTPLHSYSLFTQSTDIKGVREWVTERK